MYVCVYVYVYVYMYMYMYMYMYVCLCITTCAARGSSNWTKAEDRRRTGGWARRPCFVKILSISARFVLMFSFSGAKLPMNTLVCGAYWRGGE